jgi:eukaryotic-like serine/threonine-protein kinase
MTAAVDPLAGQIALSRYRIDALVAHGGMASVYRAHDPVLNRTVALKVLHAHLAADPSCVKRFRQEALAAAAINHPGIVSIFDTGDVAGRPCLVMEFLPGGSLADRLTRGPLASDAVTTIGIAVARALHEAHRRGLVHRDVKPGNILFTESGTPKLGDFGIAKAGPDGLTQTGQVMGTARYLAPEQLRGHPATERADQFALGVVMYEALAGRSPFGGSSDPTGGLFRTGPAPPLRAVVSVPPALDAVVMRALEEDPLRRFPDLLAMAGALSKEAAPEQPGQASPRIAQIAQPAEGGARTEAHPARPPPTRVPGTTPRRGTETVAIAVLSALVLGGAITLAAVLASRSGTDGPLGRTGSTNPTSHLIHLSQAMDFDPPPGDGTEHHEEVNNAIDGDQRTAWHTEHYDSQFPKLKPGVGIWVDLGPIQHVGTIKVISTAKGWQAQVRVSVADNAPATLDGFSNIATITGDAPSATVDVMARRVLIWIVKLPPELTMSINEIQVSGR